VRVLGATGALWLTGFQLARHLGADRVIAAGREDDGRPWNPDHVSKRFKKLAALAGVPVIRLHAGGRHTSNSLMQDAGVGLPRLRCGGAGGARTHDRQIMSPLL
jgi:hypothetical protein